MFFGSSERGISPLKVEALARLGVEPVVGVLCR
jgi:hypothetical protein